jgi:hypothetical protein
VASVRSLLAKWLGGAGAPRTGGVRSLLARWLGGAGTSAAPEGGLVAGGSADVRRVRTYEASGGLLFGGSADVTHTRGPQSVIVVFPPLSAVSFQKDREHAKKLVEEVYGINIDDPMADAIVAIARQNYGGDIAAAVGSEEVRELVERYAAATGQKMLSTGLSEEEILEIEDEEIIMLFIAMMR